MLEQQRAEERKKKKEEREVYNFFFFDLIFFFSFFVGKAQMRMLIAQRRSEVLRIENEKEKDMKELNKHLTEQKNMVQQRAHQMEQERKRF
jgi:hypothetical protein